MMFLSNCYKLFPLHEKLANKNSKLFIFKVSSFEELSFIVIFCLKCVVHSHQTDLIEQRLTNWKRSYVGHGDVIRRYDNILEGCLLEILSSLILGANSDTISETYTGEFKWVCDLTTTAKVLWRIKLAYIWCIFLLSAECQIKQSTAKILWIHGRITKISKI